jgi:hypothetical protein
VRTESSRTKATIKAADRALNRCRILLRSLVAAIVLAASMPMQVAQAQTLSTQKPNIVLMLMDNLGYGELGVYGGGILRGAHTAHRRPSR